MKRKQKRKVKFVVWKIVRTFDGMSTLNGWAIHYHNDPVAEFYGVPYAWVRKTLSMWRKMGKPYYEDED